MTTYVQVYSTVDETIRDLKLSGDEPGLYERVMAASRFISQKIGQFLPVGETRTYEPDDEGLRLRIEPVLEVTAVTDDGVPVTEYELHPATRHWPGGPYSSIDRETAWGDEVKITGTWGMWNEVKTLGMTITAGSADTTLTVTNGAKLSAGMVIQLDTEHVLITAGRGGENSPTAGSTAVTLSGSATAADEELVVTAGSSLYAGEVIAIGTEDVYIRRIVGNTLVVVRGWNGSTKAAHAAGAAIGVYRTFEATRAVNGTTAGAHVSSSVYRVAAPEDINWLARQIAGLMRMKASANFASRAGNADLGEAFYFSEFPPNQIKAIRANYKVMYG